MKIICFGLVTDKFGSSMMEEKWSLIAFLIGLADMIYESTLFLACKGQVWFINSGRVFGQ